MTYEEFKKKAKLLAKETGCGTARSHEILARSLGYNTYNSLIASLEIKEIKNVR